MDPLITVTNDIEDLELLGTAAHNLYSDAQLAEIGIQILKNLHDF